MDRAILEEDIVVVSIMPCVAKNMKQIGKK